MTDRRAKTAKEFLEELERDPAFVARREEKERFRRHRAVFRAQAEAPLVRELRDSGQNVESVWDLVAKREPYPEAIPILLAHLAREYPAKTREGIARALAVPVLDSEAWESVRCVFLDEEDDEAKWALALVLGANAQKHHFETIRSLVLDRDSGKGRARLAQALHDLDPVAALETLSNLQTDSDIGQSVSTLLETGSIRVD